MSAESKSESKDTRSRSWFCVFNNPEEHGFTGTPQEICDAFVDAWIKDSPTRTCAVTYCISADGLHHLHAVLEDSKLMRFSAVKNTFPSMHIEPTKGTKEQAEDYIEKRGKFEEKGEEVLATARHGEIKGAQGQRKDFEIIEDLIAQGKTPSEILAENFSYYRYDNYIRKAYFSKRKSETPPLRGVKVIWHLGESGSGKTYTYVNLCKQYGEDNVYIVNDYDKGGFDKYEGQAILCFDEFRGQLPYGLLLTYLQGYKMQVPSRYANTYALWTEVHIFTVLTPQQVYNKMVKEEDRDSDSMQQLLNRISEYVYHYKNKRGEYKTFTQSRDDYKSLADIQARAINAERSNNITVSFSEDDGWELILDEDGQVPVSC